MNLIFKITNLLSKRDKIILGFLLLGSFFISFLETFSISLVMLFATVATNFDLVNKNKYYSFFYKLFNCNSATNFVIIFGLLLICFYFLRGFFIGFYTYCISRFSQSKYKYFACKFFNNYLNFNYKDITLSNSNNISKVIFGDAGNLTYIVSSLLNIFAESLTVLFIYFALLFVNFKMTLVLTILLSIKVFFIIKTFSSRLERAGKKNQKLNIEMSKSFGESFGNFKIIKLFSNQKDILNKFNKASSEVIKSNIFNNMLQNSPRLILETLGFSLLISVIVYVVYFYHSANNVIPVVSMYAFAFYRFLPSINKIIASYNQLVFCKPAIESVDIYLTYSLEVLGDKKVEFKEKIEFKEVSFSYNEKNKILDNSSFIIKKGERTAFIGQSGAGKSTIIDIIMGLYKVQSGEILIDNQELNFNNLKSWRLKIGYIPQTIYLFDGTIADNIVFGRFFDEFKIIDSLKRANIYDYLLTQEGIYTKVGEAGIKISGGQRQRIAIARALYSDPEVLVLDEATSALDNQTESKIMDEIYSLNKDKTLIIVAHRLSTVERCEKIYKIEKGKVELVTNLYDYYDVGDINSREILQGDYE